MLRRLLPLLQVLPCFLLLAGCITGPPPKNTQFADLGTHRLAYLTQGQGTPTVVFLSGINCNFAVWKKVQPEVAKLTKTVAYDRGCVGWSDNSPESRDGLTIARELHAFLAKAGCPPPYVLCAHSIGGLYARLFAANYRDEVTGMVLIDATSENLPILQNELMDKNNVRMMEKMQWRMRKWLPHYGTSGEWFNRTKTFEEVRAQSALPDVPLIYLGQDVGKRVQRGKTDTRNKEADLARELALAQASLVSHGTYEIVPGAGHSIHLQRPDVVVRAIRDVIRAGR